MPNDKHKSASPEPPGAPVLRKVTAEIEQAFPLVARHTGLVLFDVDPHRLQVQWQVEPWHLEQTRQAFPAGTSDVQPELRLIRLDAPGDRRIAAVLSPPIETGETDGSARFDVSDHGVTYQVELGLASGDGGWLLLARSNQVKLPWPVGSSVSSRRGGDLPGVIDRERSIDEEAAVSEGDSLPQAGKTRKSETHMAKRPAGVGQPSVFDPTLADSGARLIPVFPHPRPRSAWSPPVGFLQVIGVLDAVEPESEAVPLPVISQPVPEAMKDVAGPRESDHLSEDMPSLRLPSALHQESESSASGELPVFPSFDPYCAVSSSHLPVDMASGPETEMYAELLVYGRATPGSSIRILGQSLTVGPNGRFFMRRTLDDTRLAGEVSFPSPSGENEEPQAE